ncbi:MAG: GyrI-like domain-containing protein [Flavobacteriales bacterium]
MKWLMRIFGIIGILFLLFLVAQFFMPSQMDITVEREYRVPPEQVYKAFANTEIFNSFNEWMKIDPENTKVEYSEIKEGKGANYQWSNTINVNEVGSGSLAIVEAQPHSLIKYEMRFGDDPTPGIGTITISEKQGKTKVAWNFLAVEMPFMFRFLNKIFYEMVLNHMDQSLINLEETLKTMPRKKEEIIEIEKESALTQFPEEKRVIALFQETSIDDKQEISMVFQESMGLIYSYLVDDQGLESGKDFSYPVGIYKAWDEKNKTAEFYVGFIVNKDVPLGEEMEMVTIPASKVVKKVYQGAYEETGKVHEAIRKFIEKEKIKPTGNPFEIYKSEPSVSNNKKITEIYYPVKY